MRSRCMSVLAVHGWKYYLAGLELRTEPEIYSGAINALPIETFLHLAKMEALQTLGFSGNVVIIFIYEGAVERLKPQDSPSI